MTSTGNNLTARPRCPTRLIDCFCIDSTLPQCRHHQRSSRCIHRPSSCSTVPRTRIHRSCSCVCRRGLCVIHYVCMYMHDHYSQCMYRVSEGRRLVRRALHVSVHLSPVARDSLTFKGTSRQQIGGYGYVHGVMARGGPVPDALTITMHAMRGAQSVQVSVHRVMISKVCDCSCGTVWRVTARHRQTRTGHCPRPMTLQRMAQRRRRTRTRSKCSLSKYAFYRSIDDC